MSAISGSYLDQNPTYVIAQEPPIHRPVIRSIASQSLANMIPVLSRDPFTGDSSGCGHCERGISRPVDVFDIVSAIHGFGDGGLSF